MTIPAGAVMSPRESSRLKRRFGKVIRFGVPLAPYTTFGIGGRVEMLITVDEINLLVDVLRSAWREGIPTTVLGHGSNLLISDDGIDGLVVINNCRRKWISRDELLVEAGARLNDVVDFTIQHGYAGCEKMAGIPGTVGGAIIGNAGAYGQSIAASLINVRLLLPTGDIVDQGPEELDFSYRSSRLKESKDIILWARLRLTKGDRRRLRQQADNIVTIRETKLPALEECAGSYFKNIEDPSAPHGKVPAGKLLEEAGAKRLRVGGAAVSSRHTNVIVNRGGATAKDVLELAELMKEKVRAKFGLELEEEVRFLGKR